MEKLTALRLESEQLDRTFPTVMVMAESPVRKQAHVLIRGAYDKPGEDVEPGIPAVLPPLPAGAANDRLGFAKWLVDPANPLLARVTVNRFWQMYFGTGIVKTVEDFGAQGEWPSHPELLDWLATEFVRTGWDVKAHAEADRDERHLPAVVGDPRRSCCSAIPRTGCSRADRASGCPRR